MADINLLPQQEQAKEGVTRLQKNLTVGSFVLLVVCALFTLGTLVVFTIFATQRNKLNDRISTASGKIDSFKEAEELLVVVKKKASVADLAITGRTNQATILESLSQITPTNVYLSDLKISEGKFTISGKAKTSLDMAGFVSSLLSANGAKFISNVNVTSLGSDEKGVYSFGLTADVVAGGVQSTSKGSTQ